ncbi:recombinase family protein [Euzebya sp.]|uniref:recombinase family protein n=1 Tax=Euzebya sp. TaxID=1971409 RepID=UPI0035147528
MRAALYARISQDEHGTEKGVQRQLEDARALADARGWQVVGEWTDNDVSAYSGATRAGYTALMESAAAGEFDRIVVYMTSRLWRSRRERAEAMDLLADRRISVAAVSGPELELASASGRMVAGILGEFDTAESAIKGERVARAALQRAQEGRASGPVLYGWRREPILDGEGRQVSFRDVEDPDQADVVRDLVDRIIGGDSMKGIAEDFNRRGILVPSGREGVRWRAGTVRKLALRPANVAKRVHHGLKRDRHGRRAPRHSGPCTEACVIGDAAWPAIIDEEQHREVVALLTSNTRRTTVASNRRAHLLTYGIGRCGVCGADLRVKSWRYHRKRTGKTVDRTLYTCEAKGCTSRDEPSVDDLVGQVVIARLRAPDAELPDLTATRRRTGAEDHRRIAEDLRRRLDAAAVDYAEGIIDRQQLREISMRLRPQMETAERKALRTYATPDPKPLRDLLGSADVEAAWARLDVRGRRRVLEVLGLSVSLMPTRQGPGFDPTDVQIEWAGATSDPVPTSV